MKLSGNFNVGGLLAKEDERYQVIDNSSLKNLVLSSTNLNPGHSTSGHKHSGQEEIYIFVRGSGDMTLIYPDKTEKSFSVNKGDIVLIEDDVHHRVFNNSNEELYFVCVFDGKRSH
jgi:mannose-6-phosphate isomerase-like protein (cupin superfamily)